MHEISCLSLIKQNILLFPRKFYLEFIFFIFRIETFYTSILNNLITNLSLFFDDSRKYIAIAFHYSPQKQSFRGIP